jgi:uncharacterized repeat protein (TIGR01451 family)
MAAVVSLLLALTGVSTIATTALTAGPAVAAPSGCGYADSSASNGAFASTICWFDFTSFDAVQARTAAGQAMQVTLDGGYVASFTVKLTDVAGTASMSVERRSTPLETRFAFGTDAYRGVPGLHSLYSLPGPAGLKGGNLRFENIQIVDALGAAVSGYSFVAADTEDNVLGESFAWTSDQPIREIERLAPAGNWGCKTPVGLGTTTVTCAGTGAGATTIAGGKSTALLVAADSPTFFATQWQTPARSGIAIGIQTAKITVTKQVAGRIGAADSFDVSVASQGGSVLGTASTGVASSATTGALTVLAGSSFTLSEVATAGSPTLLSNYDTSWSCTNTNAGSATTLPSGAGGSKTVTPAAGDDIACTVTNTAKAVALSLVKSASTAGAGVAGDLVTYSFVATNDGDLTLSGIHVDETAFSGSGSVSGIACPVTTLASHASTTCSASYTLTQADVDAGTVTNTAVAAANPPGSTAVVSSASSSATVTTARTANLTLVKSVTPTTVVPGGTVTYSFRVTNTGTVTLSGVTITETTFSGTGAVPAATCPGGSLAPGSAVTCTATYQVTPADARAGRLTNTATASATAPGGVAPPTSGASTASSIVALPGAVDPLALTGAGAAAGLGFTALNLVAAGLAILLLRRVARNRKMPAD